MITPLPSEIWPGPCADGLSDAFGGTATITASMAYSWTAGDPLGATNPCAADPGVAGTSYDISASASITLAQIPYASGPPGVNQFTAVIIGCCTGEAQFNLGPISQTGSLIEILAGCDPCSATTPFTLGLVVSSSWLPGVSNTVEIGNNPLPFQCIGSAPCTEMIDTISATLAEFQAGIMQTVDFPVGGSSCCLSAGYNNYGTKTCNMAGNATFKAQLNV